MKSGMKYFVIVLALFGFLLMVMRCAEAAEEKGTCSNPIGETIEKTASIKAMQSKPAGGLSYVFDVLGNKVPTQTDNSGKR